MWGCENGNLPFSRISDFKINVLWVLHYYLYHLSQGIWRTVPALYRICVQTKPFALLLNFEASRKLTEKPSNLPLKSRKFCFISCHLYAQPRPTSTLSLSAGTPKWRKCLFPDLFFIHCGPVDICKNTSYWSFRGELSL